MKSLSHMSVGIVEAIGDKYSDNIDEDCIDIVQIKNICNLYKIKPDSVNSISLSELNFESPFFEKNSKKSKKNKNIESVLNSKEFTSRYAFFIKTIYVCLKIDVEIFDINNDIMCLNNNYKLIKNLRLRKKKMIEEHLNVLKNMYKNITQGINEKYEAYVSSFIVKINLIDTIVEHIEEYIENKIFDKTDNLLTLILPFFYTYTQFIEEYN